MLSPLASETRTSGYSGVKLAVGITFLRTMFLAELGGGGGYVREVTQKERENRLAGTYVPVAGEVAVSTFEDLALDLGSYLDTRRASAGCPAGDREREEIEVESGRESV